MKTRAEKAAQSLLNEAGVSRAPIQVEALAKRSGAKVRYRDFDDDISGLLIQEHGLPPIIAVHSRQATVRQRFTIAHELGHLTLPHNGRPVIVEQLSRGARVHWRDGASSGATDQEEIEANQFAAALLMPAEMLERTYWEHAKQGHHADALTDILARRFAVSGQAMQFRLLNLALMDPS